MKIIQRENNEIKIIDTIKSISNLDNSILILIEKDDALKKDMKKAKCVYGYKNVYSVKMIKNHLEEIALKNAKKKTHKLSWCCVCVEELTSNENGIGDCCRIS